VTHFQTVYQVDAPTEVAPDRSQVSVLLRLESVSTIHLVFQAQQVSRAVAHRTVSEIWYVTSGTGQMWRRQDGREETVALKPGLCLSLPAGTHFQCRVGADEALSALCITTPPWPGGGEAFEVSGPWLPSGSPS